MAPIWMILAHNTQIPHTCRSQVIARAQRLALMRKKVKAAVQKVTACKQLILPARCLEVYSSARRSSCALIATMTVLADIRTAANAGGRRIPCAARTPAASGIATML